MNFTISEGDYFPLSEEEYQMFKKEYAACDEALTELRRIWVTRRGGNIIK